MKETQTLPKKLLRIKDFCEVYSISRKAFYNEVNAGMLKVRKFGKRAIRIDAEEAELWRLSKDIKLV